MRWRRAALCLNGMPRKVGAQPASGHPGSSVHHPWTPPFSGHNTPTLALRRRSTLNVTLCWRSSASATRPPLAWSPTSSASGPSSRPYCGRKGCSVISTTDDKSQPMLVWPRRHGRADRFLANRASASPATGACAARSSSSPAWLRIRHQPASELTQWFRTRVAQNGGRMKKTMITALARKLLVALWKYATAGVVIDRAGVIAILSSVGV
jgi:hypothetical protein